MPGRRLFSETRLPAYDILGNPERPAHSYRNGPLGGVGHERHEHAATGAVEQPRVPERHRERSQEEAHDNRRLQGALFQEEDGHMPAGYKHAEDEGGHHWRETGSLQPREGEASPARLLAHRPISGVD